MRTITAWCLVAAVLSWKTAALSAQIPVVIRGGGDALLRSDGGALHVTVAKQDLNIYSGADTVTVTLLDPLLRTLAEEVIPDDGEEGKGPRRAVQQAVFSVPASMSGVYRVRVSGSGSDYMWGISSNSTGLVIDTPMALNNHTESGQVFFRPPAGAWSMQAQAFHDPGRQSLPLLDAAGEVVHVFNLQKAGENETLEVAAGQGDRGGLWSFRASALDVKVQVPGNPVWTMTEEAYFAPPNIAGTLLPHLAVRYLQPGADGVIRFRFFAPPGEDLSLEFRPMNEQSDATVPVKAVLVRPRPQPGTVADRVLDVQVAAPEDARAGQVWRGWVVVAEPGKVDAVATAAVEVRIGGSAVGRTLELPIVNESYRHENVQFGYAPDYVTNEVYFDPRNRAFIRDRFTDRDWSSALTIRDRGRWLVRPFEAAVRQAFPDFRGFNRAAGFMGCKVAFDDRGGAYTLVRLKRANEEQPSALLYTPDDGMNWQVLELPGGGFDIENFSGHNRFSGPPAVLSYEFRAKHPQAKWGAYHNLMLRLPRFAADGTLSFADPVLISDSCIGACQHSGAPPSLATLNGKTHIIWGEGTEEEVPGVPTYIATYDRQSGGLGEKVFLGYAPPVNDVHNVPAVCLDSEGYIHIVTGAHGANFTYRRSLLPNDSAGGFTEPVNTLDAGFVKAGTDADGIGRQTYCSLVCDDQDTLHIAFRQWRQGVDPYHDGRIFAALSLQSKPKNGPWGPARPVVIPPRPGYSIYYHKLTIDRRGGLWLSYSYLTADTAYQKQFRELYNHPAVLVSKDRGQSWKLAESSDFP